MLLRRWLKSTLMVLVGLALSITITPCRALVVEVAPFTGDDSESFETLSNYNQGGFHFLTLALVETTDVLFAVDSIPAIFSITRDPFIVFTSNILAILGLRSFYFLLVGAMNSFRYLPVGLSAVLIFVGVKMLNYFPISTIHSLLVIGTILGIAIVASLLKAHHEERVRTR